MSDDDLETANTREAPDRIAPTALAGVRVEGSTMTATVRPASWNVVRLAEAVQP